MSSEPRQKPGRSKQDYGTPWKFIEAVERRFGMLSWDLAASKDNAKAPLFYTEEDNSLEKDWRELRGNLWLNPPFGDIATWAEAAHRSTGLDRLILMLTPASIGSNWFAEHVHGHALVLGLSPRISFDGVHPYPKDLMLSVFGQTPGFGVWRWDDVVAPGQALLSIGGLQ